jgi:16S rRNA processing protein RimM
MTPDPGARLVVGRIGRAHGLRGEVAVTFSSNRPERAEPGSVLYAGERELVIDAARPHQGRMLVQFAGVDDRTAAELLLGAELTADPLAGGDTDLDERELWVHEVVGARVVDLAGDRVGTVVAVEANPAHDLLVLDGGTLVPMVFVVEQRDGELVIDPPDGLLDL